MKRLAPILAAAVLILCLSVPALAWQDGDVAGALSKAPKAPEDETPYITQCELGSMTADAVREAAGTDIALVSAADLTGRLPSGLVTWADVKAVIRNDAPLVCAALSPAALYALLEAAVSHVELDTSTERISNGSEVFPGFCQVSGFRFRYDVSAPVGERVLNITKDGGTVLDRTDTAATLTLAAPENVLDGRLGLPAIEYIPIGTSLTESLAAYTSSHATLSSEEAERIEVIGSRDNPLIGMIPRPALIGGLAVFVILLAFWRTRYNKLKDEYGYTK